MVRVHFFIHVPYEDPGAIVSWCDKNGYKKSFSRFYEKAYFPEPEEFDMLVVMGGPMSVNDEHIYSWLAEEKNFIRKSIDGGKMVLGICLGAQLIASALGSKVENNRYKEIGWHNVNFSNSMREKLPFMPEVLTTFHWHGDTFKLPAGAESFGFSAATENQGFIYQENVIALQFHPEMTEKMILTLINECEAELSEESIYIQSGKEILDSLNNIKPNNEFLYNLLNFLTNKRL